MADFSVDSSIREDVRKATVDAADTVKEMADKIKTSYESIGKEKIWEGNSYNSFASMCESFMPAFESTENLLRAMAQIIDVEVGEKQDALEKSLKGYLG